MCQEIGDQVLRIGTEVEHDELLQECWQLSVLCCMTASQLRTKPNVVGLLLSPSGFFSCRDKSVLLLKGVGGWGVQSCAGMLHLPPHFHHPFYSPLIVPSNPSLTWPLLDSLCDGPLHFAHKQCPQPLPHLHISACLWAPASYCLPTSKSYQTF